jgi:hypothetical protein
VDQASGAERRRPPVPELAELAEHDLRYNELTAEREREPAEAIWGRGEMTIFRAITAIILMLLAAYVVIMNWALIRGAR